MQEADKLSIERGDLTAISQGMAKFISDSQEAKNEQDLSYWKLAALAVASGTYWIIATKMPLTGLIAMTGILLASLALWTLILFTRRQFVTALTVLAYLAATQPALRRYSPALPYLFIEYLMPIFALIVAMRVKGRLKFNLPCILFGLYVLIEFAGLMQTEIMLYGRAIMFPAIAIFSYLFIASQIKLSEQELRLVIYGYLIGSVTIGFLLAQIYFSGQIIQWKTASNFNATDDMGPNQISLLFAAAVFFCLVLSEKSGKWLKVVLLAIGGLLAYLMVLTFSRGGLYLLMGATVIYYVMLRKPSFKSGLAIAAFALIGLIVFNAAMNTTQGKVVDRYNEFDTTNRATLAAQGWQIFQDNPLFGVGTGNYYVVAGSKQYFGSVTGAHNEFIRAASEHGIFGLMIWSAFAFSTLLQASRSFRGVERALRLTLICLALTSMVYIGLKLAVQPFLIVLAFTGFAAKRATVVDEVRNKVMKIMYKNKPHTVHIKSLTPSQLQTKMLPGASAIKSIAD